MNDGHNTSIYMLDAYLAIVDEEGDDVLHVDSDESYIGDNVSDFISIPVDNRTRKVPTVFVPGTKLHIEFEDGRIVEI